MRSFCSYRFDDYPLSNAGGRCKISINATNQLNFPFQVGLVRPTNPYVRNGYADEVNYGNNDQAIPRSTTYMDYYVVWNPDAGSDGELRLYHWGYDEGHNNWNQKEIKYYNAPGAIYDSIIDLTQINAAANLITAIIFELKGNELLVKLAGNATEDLLPVLALSASGQTVKLEEWEAHKLENWNLPSATNFALLGAMGGAGSKAYFPRGTAQLTAGSDWYSNAVLSQNATNELRYNQLRPNLLWESTPTTEVFIYKNLVGGVIDYDPVLICGEETRDTSLSDYKQVLYVIPLPGNEANMSRNLGFGKWNIIDYISFQGSTDTDNLKTLNSIEVAQYTVHSAFVRINDLPIESFNGATSSRSNILYHIPRFSNTGKQFGELFFPVPEKTYIKLNNTDKIMLNQLKIDIVGRNERIVNDLTGASIICLHFRESK